MRQKKADRRVESALLSVLEMEESVRILEEQVAAWSEMRDELHVRSLVAETPLASAEFAEMERQLSVATAALSHQRAALLDRRTEYENLVSAWQFEENL
jgi:hypothetical protein